MPQLENSTFEKVAQGYAVDKTGVQIAAELETTSIRVYRIKDRKEVKARISELTGIALDKMNITPEIVIMGIADIAYGAEKTTDRLKALELLGRHLELFTERVKDVTDRDHDDWLKMVVVQAEGDKVGDLSFLS